MKTVLQRVSRASVTIAGRQVANIQKGATHFTGNRA